MLIAAKLLFLQVTKNHFAENNTNFAENHTNFAENHTNFAELCRIHFLYNLLYINILHVIYFHFLGFLQSLEHNFYKKIAKIKMQNSKKNAPTYHKPAHPLTE